MFRWKVFACRFTAAFFTFIYFILSVLYPFYSHAYQNAFNYTSEKLPRFSTKLYFVKKNDTLYSISNIYHISPSLLKDLNPHLINVSNKEKLTIGSTLKVPEGRLDNQDFVNRITQNKNRSIFELISQSLFRISRSKNDFSESVLQTSKAYIAEQTAQRINTWLNQYGTVQIDLNIPDKTLNNAGFEFLLPLQDKKEHLYFLQTAYKQDTLKKLLNIGTGSRYFYNHYMFGVNGFFDYDLINHHQRIGAGVEIWSDYFKLSANGYIGVSDWQDCLKYPGFETKALSGFDMQAQTYLPTLPQLGAEISYAHYFGDVQTFNTNGFVKNPFNFTFTINYTPVPLIGFKIKHERPNYKKANTSLGMQLTYRLGIAFEEQLNYQNISLLRNLNGSRYDLVLRNHDIILGYKSHGSIDVETHIHGESKKSYKPIKEISLEGDWIVKTWEIDKEKKLQLNNACYTFNQFANCEITLPEYQTAENAQNRYEATFKLLHLTTSKEIEKSILFTVFPPISDEKTFLVAKDTRLGLNEETILTLDVKNEKGQNIDIPLESIVTYVKSSKQNRHFPAEAEQGLVDISPFKKINEGVYEAILTAGSKEAKLELFTKLSNKKLKPVPIKLIKKAIHLEYSEFNISSGYINKGETVKITFKARDAERQPLKGIANKIKFYIYQQHPNNDKKQFQLLSVNEVDETGVYELDEAKQDFLNPGLYTLKVCLNKTAFYTNPSGDFLTEGRCYLLEDSTKFLEVRSDEPDFTKAKIRLNKDVLIDKTKEPIIYSLSLEGSYNLKNELFLHIFNPREEFITAVPFLDLGQGNYVSKIYKTVNTIKLKKSLYSITPFYKEKPLSSLTQYIEVK